MLQCQVRCETDHMPTPPKPTRQNQTLRHYVKQTHNSGNACLMLCPYCWYLPQKLTSIACRRVGEHIAITGYVVALLLCRTMQGSTMHCAEDLKPIVISQRHYIPVLPNLVFGRGNRNPTVCRTCYFLRHRASVWTWTSSCPSRLSILHAGTCSIENHF